MVSLSPSERVTVLDVPGLGIFALNVTSLGATGAAVCALLEAALVLDDAESPERFLQARSTTIQQQNSTRGRRRCIIFLRESGDRSA